MILPNACLSMVPVPVPEALYRERVAWWLIGIFRCALFPKIESHGPAPSSLVNGSDDEGE